MKSHNLILALGFAVLFCAGCAGMKVINPNEEKNEGTLAVDVVDGQVKLVGTHTCKLESMGNRFSAIGKTEDEARQAVFAKCQSKTVLSFCKSENVKCAKN